MNRCKHCQARTQSSSGYCLSHKTQLRRLMKIARSREYLVDKAGGAWWVWSKRGDVLSQGSSRLEALLAIEEAA